MDISQRLFARLDRAGAIGPRALAGAAGAWRAPLAALGLVIACAAAWQAGAPSPRAPAPRRMAVEVDAGQERLDALQDLIDAAEVARLEAGSPELPAVVLSPVEVRLADYLSAGYRIPYDYAAEVVSAAVDVGRSRNIDPLLILAVSAVESSFNPKAQSSAGAQGLMQVHTRVHAEKFAQWGGSDKAFELVPSLDVGTRILKAYISRSGSVAGALKRYVGAAMHAGDGGYGRRVITEQSRLREAALGNGKRALQLLIAGKPGEAYEELARAGKAGYGGFYHIAARAAESSRARGAPPVETM
ncbi:MAG: transglycosylase SLT domain-containing protein [Duodenibacillus sp.]|nr:transglycosylase SLT domain-containing protein [Duodenibacillus sp.]